MKQFLSGLLLASVMVVTGLVLGGNASAQAGCDDYAIMRCGATNAQQFVNKANANAPGDLKTIYRDYGLSPNEYGRFVDTAKQGKLYDDGRIVVDGQVVGRSTQNVGRVRDANFNQQVTVDGKNYWGGSFGSTYHADVADVMVMFDEKGVMEFVMISSCGNPQRFTPTKPDYSCDLLKREKVNGQKNTYSFTTDASAAKGAKVVKAVYDFGDGSAKRTVTNLDRPVEHTFTQTSTVRVTVHVELPGGGTQTVTSADCMKKITVEATPPPKPPKPPVETPAPVCTKLESVPLDAEKRSFRFTATADFDKGINFTGADFNFGDGVVMQNVRPNGNLAIIEHSYARAGTYQIVATLKFTNPDGTSTSANCQATVTPTDQVEYCKPGIPVGSPECEDQLTKTGAGTIVAGIVGGSGTLAAIGHYFVRRRFLV